MSDDFPYSVLKDYRSVVENLQALGDVAEDIEFLLEAIEELAEGEARPETIAALARAARSHLDKIGEASLDISDYCRAADVAFCNLEADGAGPPPSSSRRYH